MTDRPIPCGATATGSSPAGTRSSSSESHDAAGQWWRSYGNELWEFDSRGLMRCREASINDVPIGEAERRIFGPRPDGERGTEFPLR